MEVGETVVLVEDVELQTGAGIRGRNNPDVRTGAGNLLSLFWAGAGYALRSSVERHTSWERGLGVGCGRH
jgi:hypothetical protein